MRTLSAIIALSCLLFAQSAQKVKMREVSVNGKYSISVEGGFYEGFSGPLIVRLHNFERKKLWERRISGYRNFIVPKVSNSGTTVLLYDGELHFIDSTNQDSGTFKPDSDWMMYFDSEENERIKSTFSEDGRTYYDIIKEQNSLKLLNTKLIAVDNTGVLKWNLELGEFEFGRIRVIQSRIIVDDFGKAAVYYINRVAICDTNGRLIKQLDYDLKSAREKLIIDPVNFEVIVEYENTQKAYSLSDGNYIREIEKKELMKLDKDKYYGSQYYAE